MHKGRQKYFERFKNTKPEIFTANNQCKQLRKRVSSCTRPPHQPTRTQRPGIQLQDPTVSASQGKRCAHSHPRPKNCAASLTQSHLELTPPRAPGPAAVVTQSNTEHAPLWATGEQGLCDSEQPVPAPPRPPGQPCWGDLQQPTPTSPQPRRDNQEQPTHTCST